jgi:hypothetical protein
VNVLSAILSIIQIRHSGDIVDFFRENHAIISSKISHVNLGDYSEAIHETIGDNMESVNQNLKKEYSRLYVDIIAHLPGNLSLWILNMLDMGSALNAAFTSKKWYTHFDSQGFWKLKSNLKGWCVAFVPPKVFDYKLFYRKMIAMEKQLGLSLFRLYEEEMATTSSLK